MLSTQGLAAKMPTPTDEPECVDCNESKRSAEVRAAADATGGGQLQLGECTPLYREWTACIARTGNQAAECKDVLKRFQACHASLGVPKG